MTQATPDAESVVRTHAEMWNERDYSKVPDVISETYVEYNPAMPEGEIRGPDELEGWMRQITSAFPDFRATVVDLLAGEDVVMTELEFAMTHEGEFNGISPTGREVTFRAMGRYLVDEGRVQELHNHFDPGELFEQLGVSQGEKTA